MLSRYERSLRYLKVIFLGIGSIIALIFRLDMNIKDFEKKEWFIVGLSILAAILFGCLVFRSASCGPQDETETDCNKDATYLWKIQSPYGGIGASGWKSLNPKGNQTRGYLFGLKDIPASLTGKVQNIR